MRLEKAYFTNKYFNNLSHMKALTILFYMRYDSLTSTYLIFPDALFAEVAIPSLALVRVVLAVVAPLALVAPIVAVHVTVADLLLVDVVRALAVVLV